MREVNVSTIALAASSNPGENSLALAFSNIEGVIPFLNARENPLIFISALKSKVVLVKIMHIISSGTVFSFGKDRKLFVGGIDGITFLVQNTLIASLKLLIWLL
jgi:hypothetical protein